MMGHDLKVWLLIALSLLIAAVLVVVPMPQSLVVARPEWIYMVLFFWVMMAPQRVGVISAFFVGCLTDLLSGTVLGLHALLFSLTAFLILHFYVRIHGLPIWQRALLFFGILLVYFAMQSWMFAMTDVRMNTWHIIVPALTSAVLWPWVYLLLRDFQQRYEIG